MVIWPYIFAMIVLILYSLLILDWHARSVFIARAYCRRYGHGKSWNRGLKHYKSNWSFIQRALWIHAFKEWYEHEYRLIAYLSYVHVALSILTIGCLYLDEYIFKACNFWHYVFAIFGVYTILRFVYDNAIGRRK